MSTVFAIFKQRIICDFSNEFIEVGHLCKEVFAKDFKDDVDRFCLRLLMTQLSSGGFPRCSVSRVRYIVSRAAHQAFSCAHAPITCRREKNTEGHAVVNSENGL
jgi:hypothetical protein